MQDTRNNKSSSPADVPRVVLVVLMEVMVACNVALDMLLALPGIAPEMLTQPHMALLTDCRGAKKGGIDFILRKKADYVSMVCCAYTFPGDRDSKLCCPRSFRSILEGFWQSGLSLSL